MPKHVRRRRPGWAAAVLAALGACLVVAGGLLVLRPAAVHAEPFRVEATAGSTAGATPAPVTPRLSPRVRVPEPDGAQADATQPGDAPPPAAIAAVPVPASPRTLAFPGQGATARILPVGVLPSGALQLPANPQRIGWWAAGALPGEDQGTVVLAGHMDGQRRASTMRALLAVEPGDRVEVVDGVGGVHAYRITERALAPVRRVDPALFTREGPPRLVLITCGGEFDPEQGYLENIIVTAVPVA